MDRSYYPMIWASLVALSFLVSLGVWFWNWKRERGENPILEGIYILPCLVFGIGANVIHLVFYGFYGRYIASSLEILVVAGLWITVFKLNMESENPQSWWQRNTLAAAAMVGVMAILRSFIY